MSHQRSPFFTCLFFAAACLFSTQAIASEGIFRLEVPETFEPGQTYTVTLKGSWDIDISGIFWGIHYDKRMFDIVLMEDVQPGYSRPDADLNFFSPDPNDPQDGNAQEWIDYGFISQSTLYFIEDGYAAELAEVDVARISFTVKADADAISCPWSEPIHLGYFKGIGPLFNSFSDNDLITTYDGVEDTDGDGFCDVADNCPNISNPDQSDLEGDCMGDVCDPCTDTDDDGFGNPGMANLECNDDNCPDLANPDQVDVDLDEIGDACDICIDNDDDGFANPGYTSEACPVEDNCPDISNPEQDDFDGDGLGDLCDACLDSDADGFGDPGVANNTCRDDNCPTTSNPEQTDTDGDGIGDGCDPCTDTDQDGFGDPNFENNTCQTDICPEVYDPLQGDRDGDGIGDVCDPEPDYANEPEDFTDVDGGEKLETLQDVGGCACMF